MVTGNGDVLNAQEAAQLLGAHVETIRRLARKGAIPSFKIGKDWRFRRDILFQWMETQNQIYQPSCILVIDDDPSVCKLIRRILEPQGFKVVTVANGRDGLEQVQRNPVNLVLLDLKMSVMNGPEFVRELRKTHPDLPAIIVTGYPDSKLLMEAYVHGPLMLIPKPIEKNNLLAAVNITLEGTLLEKENASYY